MRKLFKATRLLVLICSAMMLAACQTMGGAGLVQSTATVQLAPEAASTIAGDMVGRLAERVGPGTTTIQLRPDGSPFGQALEASLREWGYAVATDQVTEELDVVTLAYVVDDFEGGILVRLSTHALDLTRIYRHGTEGVTPISPLSVMERGAGAAT
ncbi:MAG: conjugal transfer protein TrbH [Rhizobiaceae bacterium]